LKDTISHEKLLELLDYDAETGELVRRCNVRGLGPNRIGGRPRFEGPNGYAAIGADSLKYLYHRLVWFWHHNEWPEVIDHVDGDKQNNRIENLRACTQSQNLCNAQIPSDNKSGFKGVSWSSSANKWRARCGLHKVQHNLGVFDTREEAAEAVRAFRSGLHGAYTNHGIHLKDLRQELVG
jgi:hypothetical protein